MRQLYIRSTQLQIVFAKSWPIYCTNGHICASCLTFSCNFLQNAEIRELVQKLFLFRSAASSLTVTLPNMDRVMGGECA